MAREIPLERAETVIGRSGADVPFEDDMTMAPKHAIVRRDANGVRISDLTTPGSGATWFFIRDVHVLKDGEILLLGSQVIRYRNTRKGSDSPDVSQAGSRVPSEDVAVLEQLLSDGRTRDVCYVPEGRAILIGREHGNWVFPYDQTMSARHAEVRSRPAAEGGEVVIRDLGSRNGVGVAVHAEQALVDGDRLLLGRQLLRVDLQ